jgi:hypothetical protein
VNTNRKIALKYNPAAFPLRETVDAAPASGSGFQETETILRLVII